MKHEISLIDYLPMYIQEYDEIKKIMGAENPEFQMLWNTSEQIRNNLFVLTANENGIKRYEQFLNIYPSTEDNLESRKLRILIKINEQPPYTIQALKKQLEIICGHDNFRIHVDYDSYVIYITFTKRINDLRTVHEIINNMKPANMAYKIATRLTREITPNVYLAALTGCRKVYNITVSTSRPEIATKTNAYLATTVSTRKTYNIDVR